MYPLHIALASTSSLDVDVEMAVVDSLKAHPNDLLTPTNAVRVIQLVEMPAPPRRMPPSSASASSSSASASEDEDDQEDDEAASYCSSAADDVEDEEEEIQAREAEASKMTRILAWRAQFAIPPFPSPLSVVSVPTTPPSLRLSPPMPSPTTPRPPVSRKRSAASSVSSVSAPHSKRSRTSSVSMRATAAPSTRFESDTPTKTTGLFLTPPSPTTLARRHTSPRHHHSASLPVNSLSAGPSTPNHHRAPSLSLPPSLDTVVCPACDRRFSTKRAFRVHALHSGEGVEEQEAACWAAVSYALEAAAARPPSP
ncbi:hypothetical protein C8R46DRAFT_114657 [Mycena filopes]|nr:hypothetical protein C8R46DRAFT_114657 [Mycena filopes]